MKFTWKKKLALLFAGCALFVTNIAMADDTEDWDNNWEESSYSETTGETGTVTTWESPSPTLESSELTVFGQVGQGAIIDRLDRLDQAVVGAKQSGTVTSRIAKSGERLRGGSASNISIIARVNATEWALDGQVSIKPLERRLADLESRLVGRVSNYSLETRSKEVASHVIDSQAGVTATLPKGTLVWVEFVDPLHSKTSKIGDTARIRVFEDVFVDGSLIFPKGAMGQVTVKDVKQAKTMSRNGKVAVDFDYVETISGQKVHLIQGTQSMAATAAYAETADPATKKTIIVGEAITVGGAFFNRENASASPGDRLYVEADQDYEVIAVKMQ